MRDVREASLAQTRDLPLLPRRRAAFSFCGAGGAPREALSRMALPLRLADGADVSTLPSAVKVIAIVCVSGASVGAWLAIAAAVRTAIH